MNPILKIIYAPVDQFIRHPELALVMASGFVILMAITAFHAGQFKARSHILTLIAAVLWVLFALNEFRAQAAGWNIRVDLLLTWPILLAVSVGAVWLGVQQLGSRTANERNADQTP